MHIRTPKTQTILQAIHQQQQLQDTPTPPEPMDSAEDTDPPAPAPPTTPDPPRTGKVITMATSRMAQLKRDEREKGKRAALSALDNEAKELGYASHADMIQKLKAKKARGATPPAAAREPEDTDNDTAPTNGSRRSSRADREIARLQEQRRAANRARAASDRKARELERQREADRAEHELRIVAVQAGVKDVDYALSLLQRELANKTDTQLKEFDEEAFFKIDLRKKRPYLYETTEEPVTTSPTTSDKDKTLPKPGTPPVPSGDKKDARSMTKQQFDEYLRTKNLTPPHLGMPG
jgi:hypothetical protein